MEATSRAGRHGRKAMWWLGAAVVLTVAVAVTNVTTPKSSAGDGPVDALLVLGTPATSTGGPTRSEWWRVTEAVREYHAGAAAHILFSGGAAANRFVEADTMAQLAMKLGVPADAILEERESRTTLENIRNSEAILKAHGWRRVEVISVADHLRRASVLLAKTPLVWRVHAAPAPGRRLTVAVYSFLREAVGTTILRWFGTGAEPFLHGVSRVLGKIVHAVRGTP